jgi:hypothetical protein
MYIGNYALRLPPREGGVYRPLSFWRKYMKKQKRKEKRCKIGKKREKRRGTLDTE